MDFVAFCLTPAFPVVLAAVFFVLGIAFFAESDRIAMELQRNIYFCKGTISGKSTKTKVKNRVFYTYPVEYRVYGVRKTGQICTGNPKYKTKDPVDVIVDLETMQIVSDAA